LQHDVPGGLRELHHEHDPDDDGGVGEELQQRAAGPLGVDPHGAAA
jgi:hypothetical protein